MDTIKLTDILVTPLSRINIPGGDVLHGMKQSDVGYAGFGESYFSWVSVGGVKAWKRHMRMTMNVVVPVGQVQFVFRMINTGGVEEFRVEEIGEDRYARITVPPGIWFGFKGLKKPKNLVLNIANIPHDPTEVQRKSLNDIKYVWS